MFSRLILRLLPVTALLGWQAASGAPATSLTPNGWGTIVAPPSGGIYNIQGGTIAGTNLYHTFSTFNLGTGNTANFNVTSNITTILARVTGGPSSIDGTITSTIGPGGPLSSANLFLLNPAGVIFTAHAQLNLGGSFIVSTADTIKLSDGSIFYGDVHHPINDAGLSSAPVSSFGFLSPAPAAVSSTGARLGVLDGMGLHVISGDVNLDGATLSAPGGHVSIFSAAGSGEVPFTLASPGSGYGVASVTQFGAIQMTHSAQAIIDGTGGGSLVIRGGKIAVNGSFVTSGNFGPVVGGNISVQATSLAITRGGYIATDSFGGVKGGSIAVNVAQDMGISGTGSQISADTETAGDTGQITAVVGGAVNLGDGGDIITAVSVPGVASSGGTISVTSGSMNMTGNAKINSFTFGDGNAGNVQLTLTSGALTMEDTAEISSQTFTSGKSGNVVITAPQMSLTNQALISTSTPFATGNAGNVTIKTGLLSIQGTGSQPPNSLGIISQSHNTGDAGSVSVDCSQAVLSGGAVISASSDQTQGGTIQIAASDSLSLFSGSSINTSAPLNGGNITLRVGRLLYLDGSNIEAFTGYQPIPGVPVGGHGGNILIDPRFVVLNHSLISANDLSGVGQNGNILNVADFFFTNGSLLHATGTIDTTPPDLDLAASLVALPGNIIDAKTKLRESCAQSINHEFSTLTVVGRGGTEAAPEELQPDFGTGP